MAFATWNPSDKGTNITLSSGNLTLAATGTSQNFARSTISKSAGKWYWEVTVNSLAATHEPVAGGIATSANPFSNANFVVAATGWGYWGHDGKKYNGGAGVVYGSTYGVNDVVNVALDMDNGKIWFGKNGTWQNSGDPVGGTNAAYTGLSGATFACSGGDGGGNSQTTANFGASAFSGSVPSGFSAGLFDDVTPVADFSGTPTSGNAPLSVAFTDLSTNTPTSWSWDFGDGNTSTLQNPTNIYAAVGTYTVKLTATNIAGSNTDTKTNFITVSSFVTPGRSGLGGDDVPRHTRVSPNARGWDRKAWERDHAEEGRIEETLKATYARLTEPEAAISTLSKVDAIVRPVAKREARDVPLRIDWKRMAEDFERSNRLMALAREEAELRAQIEDEDEILMLVL